MHYDAICRLLAVVLGLGWATTAYAASTAPDLTGLPWAQIGVGTALALWGGLTFTAQRIIKGLRDGKAADCASFNNAISMPKLLLAFSVPAMD